MNKQLQHGSIHHKENGGKELKVGSGGGRERKTIQGKDFCIDTQAVMYQLLRLVGKMERDRGSN